MLNYLSRSLFKGNSKWEKYPLQLTIHEVWITIGKAIFGVLLVMFLDNYWFFFFSLQYLLHVLA